MMQEEMFVCEICKCHTPKRYEGAEPNTCQQCMPLFKTNAYEGEDGELDKIFEND